MAMMLKPKSSNDASVVPDGTYTAKLTKVSQSKLCLHKYMSEETDLSL